MDAPQDALSIALAAVGVVVGTTVAGAAIGAIAGPPCPTGGPTAAVPLCGPGWNAALGGSLGLVGSGILGLGVAIFSPGWRAVGLTTAGIVTALAIVGGAQQALATPKQVTAAA